MKIIDCPLNGPRNAQEFICGGEVQQPPAQADGDVLAWADYIFLQNNPRGVIREWWCHVASGYWFIAERDTISDTFLRTYPSKDLGVPAVAPAVNAVSDPGPDPDSSTGK